MTRRNEDIRQMIKEAGIKHWQVAEQIGVDATTLCRWLRFPLEGDKRKVVLFAIRELSVDENA